MSQTINVGELFQTAHEDGVLSPQAMNALNVMDIGAQIQAGLGGGLENVSSSEVILVGVMPDDSGSIRFAGNSQLMRDGHNLVIESLIGAKQRDNVFIHTRYLNGFILNPFCLLGQAKKMDNKNYDPNKGTPLYDQAVVFYGTLLAEYQRYRNEGIAARTVSLIITDGHDEHSMKAEPKDVAAVVTDMLMTEDHIIAAMGIDDGRTDFRRIFQEMGIRNEWILTPKNTPTEIRKTFQTFSSSAVRASQSAASFSQTAGGGFGA